MFTICQLPLVMGIFVFRADPGNPPEPHHVYHQPHLKPEEF